VFAPAPDVTRRMGSPKVGANRRRQDRPRTTDRRPPPAPARTRHPPVSIPDLHAFRGVRSPD
jgi:hypothetical protein